MKLRLFLLIVSVMVIQGICAQNYPPVMSMQKQTETYNLNLEWKVNNVLPGIMEREDLEMWLIICFE
ncbi:MAG: hypothetical protein QNK33_09025, partial [Bacteroidales bacterium]|nr:hypothetical protein [Bacteroidales bacterium]